MDISSAASAVSDAAKEIKGDDVSNREFSKTDFDKPFDTKSLGLDKIEGNYYSTDFDKPIDFKIKEDGNDDQDLFNKPFDDRYVPTEIETIELPSNLQTSDLNESTKVESVTDNNSNVDSSNESLENRGLDPLTEEDKARLKEETGWSDEIIDSIGSKQEAEIYKNAGLVEAEIDGRPCLIRPDIDMNQTDDYGRTNKERMEQGLAPLDSQGRPIELHHIGQKMDGPLAELTSDEHRGCGNYGILHDPNKESEIDRTVFKGQKEEHWKNRAKENDNDNN